MAHVRVCIAQHSTDTESCKLFISSKLQTVVEDLITNNFRLQFEEWNWIIINMTLNEH